MNSFEFNKIFAAILVAGIVASFSGFIADHAVHPKQVVAHGAEASGDAGAGAAAAPQNPEPVMALIASADVARGESVFKACAACHTTPKGGPNGVGPNLWNIMTRGAAAADGFAYSEGMAGHKGQSWDYAALNHFLWKPKAYVPGTKMTYVGLKKPEDRAALIAYLRTLSDSAPALPSDGQIAAEQAALAPAPAEAAPAAAEAAPAAAEAPAAH